MAECRIKSKKKKKLRTICIEIKNDSGATKKLPINRELILLIFSLLVFLFAHFHIDEFHSQ